MRSVVSYEVAVASPLMIPRANMNSSISVMCQGADNVRRMSNIVTEILSIDLWEEFIALKLLKIKY